MDIPQVKQCRVCASNDLTLYYSEGRDRQYKYYRCGNCKLVNYDLSGGLDQGQYVALHLDPDDDQSKSSRSQDQSYNFIKQHIPTRGSLIDIGCGNGRLLKQAREDGWQVRGLELSQEWADFVGQRLAIDVDVANFLEFDTDDCEQYDVVILRHVLEHLSDSLLAMSKIHAMLKPGGHALLEFPNIDGFDKRLKRTFRNLGVYQKKYSQDYKPGHCNEFCEDSFKYLVKNSRFELVRWETYSLKPLSNFIYNRWCIGNKARALVKRID